MRKNKTALLIVDMQNDAVLPGAPMNIAGAQATIPQLKKLLEHFHQKELPVFHVIREYRTDGSDIEITRLDNFLTKGSYLTPDSKGAEVIKELAPSGNDYIIIKNRFSAFMNTELDFILRRLNISRIVVCGTQYPNCIRATIYDGVSYGYDVISITDATSAQTPEIAKSNINDIQNIGVSCITLDEYLKISD